MDIESSSRGYLTAFFRQIGALMLVSAVIFGAGIWYLKTTKPVYEAGGSVVVKFGQDAGAEGTGSGMNEADSVARKEIIKSYIKIIFSHNMLQELVREFGVYRLYPDLKDSVEENIPPEDVAVRLLMERDLKVSAGQSYIIDIAVQNENPKVASEFANLVMDAFIRRRTEIYNKPETGFLNQQVEEAREKLEDAQRELLAFKQETGISAIDEELEQLLRQKSELSTLAYSAITEAQAKLADLESKEAEMVATYREDSPIMIRLRQTIAVARADLERRQKDLNSSNGTGGSLSAKISNVDQRVAYLESKRGRYDELRQKVAINEENYIQYRKRGEEARINNLLVSQNISRISVLDKPSPPVVPIKPKRSIILALVLLAALMAGLGTALARELLDDRFYNPDQVNKILGVPVLATFEKEFVK